MRTSFRVIAGAASAFRPSPVQLCRTSSVPGILSTESLAEGGRKEQSAGCPAWDSPSVPDTAVWCRRADAERKTVVPRSERLIRQAEGYLGRPICRRNDALLPSLPPPLSPPSCLHDATDEWDGHVWSLDRWHKKELHKGAEIFEISDSKLSVSLDIGYIYFHTSRTN